MPERTYAIDRYGLSDEEYIEELEGLVRDLEDECSDLEARIADLEYDIDGLRDELREAEDRNDYYRDQD